MKVTKITFEQLFPTGQYANQRLGMEIEFQEGDFNNYSNEADVVQSAFSHAKELVNKSFQSLNPELQHQPTDYNTGEVLQEQPVDRRVGLLADDILSSPDLKTLESYKLLVKAKPELQGAYDVRYAYFQNQLK
jgi:hypothetical protein